LVTNIPESDHSDSSGGGAPDYEIGEEHPGIHESDAVFEARRALELGALELVLGRLSSRQLAGYRLLAELTLPYVEDDHFVDAAAYTDTNAAFHDYLFTQTGNEHLLRAYQALGVKNQMAEVLRNATWCDPRCATDHVEIVDAFAAQDRDRARTLITEHAERSKTTMRRAMDETAAHQRPAFVTPGRFAGQVVLVTGAAQGIGECVARRIAAEGGTLVLADRSDLVECLATDLSRDGRPATGVMADLETWQGASDVVAKALAEHGRVDVSIHTVGGTIWAKPFADYPPDQIEAEISRSLFPTLWSCRAVTPPMIQRGSGTIVNVSSVATRGLNRVPYAAAKGGVNAITSALALELAPHGIRVVATAPGGTDAPPRRVPRGPAPESEQERAWYQTIVDQTVESSLLKRYGTLDEQASAICFLASREASYITGTVLPVAGGDLG
jgi:benzoate/toluate 1,2-dioxygenase reductase subunit